MSTPVDWNTIAASFQKSLLLGNGASIAANRRFAYKNLLRAAQRLNLITSQLEELFDYLKTEDFELVLEMLWHTYHINEALLIKTAKARTAYQDIRKALVNVIREHHCSYDDSKTSLAKQRIS